MRVQANVNFMLDGKPVTPGEKFEIGKSTYDILRNMTKRKMAYVTKIEQVEVIAEAQKVRQKSKAKKEKAVFSPTENSVGE